ncbi:MULTISPECIES: DUF2273 domain-containing protein [Tomitella]|uniref:DUF2273 domain-containing protein n=1 Tax=Tomitella fengzijianii TaxID=2597660 RepID=A0A516X0I3_9ACTN|nr:MULTISPECIES: DUF2273 domain-containing protein [Tomitella]QDQ96592.1 DUF2273 domain-containing protein [Tomitella fengzijianii]
MSMAAVGLIAGILLVIAGTTGGLLGFVFAVLLGAVGLALGAHHDGAIDLAGLLRSRGRG